VIAELNNFFAPGRAIRQAGSGRLY